MHDFTLEMEFNDFLNLLMKFCQFSKIIFRAAAAEGRSRAGQSGWSIKNENEFNYRKIVFLNKHFEFMQISRLLF